jgi:hypothetical protein
MTKRDTLPDRGPSRGIWTVEFSDHDRSPRFPPGWWIVPAALVGILILLAAVIAAGT